MELAIVLMMLLIAIGMVALKLSGDGLTFPFQKKTNLFTPTERNFLALLEQAVGNEYRILCRVRLSDIVTPRRGTKPNRQAMLRASSKQLDFVLCDKQDLTPVVAVDLVYKKSEKQGYKLQRDWFLHGALEAARIPHIRMQVRAGYQPKDIRECIAAKLAPIKYKEPKAPLVKGTLGNGHPGAPKRDALNRPIAA